MRADLAAEARRRVTEADLLSGIIELSRYARRGLPEVHQGHIDEAPSVTLDRIMGSVERSDLVGSAAELWARAQALHGYDRPITWEGLLAGASEEARRFALWAQEHGLAVAYQSIPASERLVAHGAARERFLRAQAEAAQAIEDLREAVAGVAI
jgi:hypothetical protein